MNPDMKLALHVDDNDNVATVFAQDVVKGSMVEVKNRRGSSEVIKMLSDVPFGHKIATDPLKKGDPVIKYGQSIGTASVDIQKGDYVHIHNMEAARGRGDLEGTK